MVSRNHRAFVQACLVHDRIALCVGGSEQEQITRIRLDRTWSVTDGDWTVLDTAVDTVRYSGLCCVYHSVDR